MPTDAATMLVDVGNVSNDETTATTLPEVMASTVQCEKSWIVMKDSHATATARVSYPKCLSTSLHQYICTATQIHPMCRN